MTTSQHLRNARRAIHRYGWIQENYGSRDTGYCAEGACVFEALGDDTKSSVEGHDAAVLLEHILNSKLGPTALPQWNDMPGRTKKEIIELFDEAIGLLETQEAA